MKSKKLLWGLGVLLLAFMVINAGVDDIKVALSQADVGLMVLLACLQIFTLGINSYQWFYLLNKDKKKISFIDTFAIYLAGGFIESLTPSSKLGGEAAKVYLFRKESGLKYNQVTSCLISHKYISLFPFLLLALIVVSFAALSFNLPKFVYLSILIFLAGFVGVYYFQFWDLRDSILKEGDIQSENSVIKTKIYRTMDFLQRAIKNSQKTLNLKELSFLFLTSFIVWALYPVKLYLISSSIGLEASFILVAVITYAAYLVSILPLSPGGLGTFEGSVALIFSLNGFSFARGLSVALLSRLITYWFPLLLSIIATLYIIIIKKYNFLSLGFNKKTLEVKN